MCYMTAGQPLNDRLMRCMCRSVNDSVSDYQMKETSPFVFYSTIDCVIAPGISKERRGKKKERREKKMMENDKRMMGKKRLSKKDESESCD